jgi:curved DNA-binding protein CbpA
MTDDLDVYKILRVDPSAEDFVVEAAYRALARHFHPDGSNPSDERMATINRAYDQVKTPERRKRYDRLLRSRPMGPGAEPIPAPATTDRWASRTAAPENRGPTIDFGRYQGWTLKDLAKHDPDYLRWLARHSSGVRYRNQIAALLPPEPEAARR